MPKKAARKATKADKRKLGKLGEIELAAVLHFVAVNQLEAARDIDDINIELVVIAFENESIATREEWKNAARGLMEQMAP